MIKGSKEEIDEIVRQNVCSEDGGMLFTAYIHTEDCYAARCEKDHYPEAVKGNPSLTQQYKQGAELSEPIKSNVKRAIEKRAARLPGAPRAVTFHGVPTTDLGTGAELSEAIIQALIDYAHKYGLDPERGHVCLMYGKPYITIDGYLFHANRSGAPYQMSSRPLKPEERAYYQVADGDYAWETVITKPRTGDVFHGLGIVTREEMTAMSKKNPEQLAAPVVAKHPQQLAQKRGDWQALRRAFPIGETEEGKHSDNG